MSSLNLENLSQDEINKLIKEEYEKNRKLKKERSIKLLLKLRKQNEKLSKVKSKSKSKSKSYQDYYQECIKGKVIPKDTPYFLKKALLKAKKVYEKGIILEKSGLANFNEKYTIEGEPGLIPWDYFGEKAEQIKYFLRNYQNTKVRMLLVCLMERQIIEDPKGKSKIIFEQSNAYFQSRTYINDGKTEVKVILKDMIK